MLQPLRLIGFLAALIFPTLAYTDFNPRAPQRTRMKQHVESRDLFREKAQYSSSNEHEDQINCTDGLPDARGLRIDNRNNKDLGGDILYPTDPALNKDCSFGLCTGVKGYPKDKISSLVAQAEFAKMYFAISDDSVIIANRFNDEELSLCETRVHSVLPEKANNTMNVEKLIVNVEGHNQIVVFETCITEGKCKFSETFPLGYTSYCQQKYNTRKLMVYAEDGKLDFDLFKVPSCCVCTLKMT